MLQGGLAFIDMLNSGHAPKANFTGQCHEVHGNVCPVFEEIHVNFFINEMSPGILVFLLESKHSVLVKHSLG